MDLIIFTIVGVSSMVALIVAFVLCAKRQSFTIEHDYDPNYVAPSIAAKNAYRVRHVHQPIPITSIENGHSKNRYDSAVKNDQGVKKSAPEVIVNNNEKVEFVKETPGAQTQRKDGSVSESSPSRSHPAKDSMKQLRGNEVQRVPSKRKAPIVPDDSVTPAAKPNSVTTPTVSVTSPSQSGTTSTKASAPQGQKVAVASNPQRQSKKTTAPTPHPTPIKASASATKKELPTIKTPQTAASVGDAPPVSDTSSLPRASKTTPSPERLRYVKKSSTLPGRSSKRQAPVAPGQAQAVVLAGPKIEINTVPSDEDTVDVGHVDSKPTVAPGKTHTETVSTESDVSGTHRNSRHVLDRLPSLPKEKQHNSEFNVNQSDMPTDSIDGSDDIIGNDSPKEDPYAVIKNRKMDEDNVEHLTTAGDAVEDIVTSSKDDESPVLEVGNITLEPATPEVTKDGSPSESTGKGEPPYAKVIKRNKRNRANVRVHFKTGDSEEITPKKPSTPGALISLNAEGEDKVQFDDIMAIPEGTSYD